MNVTDVVEQMKHLQGILSGLTILNLVGYKWPKQACVKDNSTFDFIIVGGGTAGCIIANRLIEQGNKTVLLIEAGGHPPIEAEMPGLFTYLKRSKYDWGFSSSCDDHAMWGHDNNVVAMTQGKMLGGSSSLNYCGYEHGNEHDYNWWAKVTNDSTWSWESVQSAFQVNEKLIDNIVLNSPDKKFYGTKGKIKIMNQYFKRNDAYFAAFKELGWNSPIDINPNNPLGFKNLMVNIGDNLRQTTAHKFLIPVKENPNLHVLINTLVSKIIFDDQKRAIGVEIITKDNEVLTIKANLEVIVSAGAIKSPHLLMLSGIGPSFHLKSKGIKVISNLPVGQNFEDHVNTQLVYKLSKAKIATKLDNPHKYPYAVFEGLMALNTSQKYPDYQVIGLSLGQLDVFMQFCAFYFHFKEEICKDLGKVLETKELLLVFITYLYPRSRGEIRLGSTDPHEHPIIIPGYYSNYEDVINHANYVQDFNRILGTSYFKKVNAEFDLPDLEKCKGMEVGSPEFWRCYTVSFSDTAHYFSGTCAMNAVVDSRLRVIGTKGLRVIDASTFPTTIGAMTFATVAMVAQKGAEFIRDEHYH